MSGIPKKKRPKKKKIQKTSVIETIQNCGDPGNFTGII